MDKVLTDEEIKQQYFNSLYPQYKDVGSKKLLLKEVVKNAKGKKSGYYQLSKKQLRAILAKQ